MRIEHSEAESDLSSGSSCGSKIVRNQARFEKDRSVRACRYDTYFTKVDTPWQSRWSAYSSSGGPVNKLRKSMVVQSLLVAVVLGLAVAEACRRCIAALSSAERSFAHVLQESNVRCFTYQVVRCIQAPESNSRDTGWRLTRGSSSMHVLLSFMKMHACPYVVSIVQGGKSIPLLGCSPPAAHLHAWKSGVVEYMSL